MINAEMREAYSTLWLDDTSSYNTLLAGTIGSGKTYVALKMIEQLATMANTKFVIIDPKSTEYFEYENHIKTLWYASDDEEIYEVLCKVFCLMKARFRKMREEHEKSSNEDHVFVFIDEMAMLMNSREHKKEYIEMMTKIILIGRSAHVHLVLGTQTANRNVIPVCIRDNMPNIICLNQQDASRYRYIIGKSYAELPKRGYAYVKTPNMKLPEKVKSQDAWSVILQNA